MSIAFFFFYDLFFVVISSGEWFGSVGVSEENLDNKEIEEFSLKPNALILDDREWGGYRTLLNVLGGRGLG